MSHKVGLLDCTLRDGGYINNWRWGFQCARDIIRYQVKANVDVIEVGFLRDIDEYDCDITIGNHIYELNRLLPDNANTTMFAAMAMCSNYDISKLEPYCGTGIEMIRVTAHDYDICEGLEFAKRVQRLGYKVSFNPINIMGYTDEKILWLLSKINELNPYQFAIVDTFGSMKRRDMERLVMLTDNNLNKDIRLAVHLHENMSLSFCLAQEFIDYHLTRPTMIDASLMGMGRVPGNLPIELIADYMNEVFGKPYDMDYMMDAIQDYIEPMKGNMKWGYTPAYFLSAHFNLHRNYAEFYLGKGNLTNKDIHHILSRFDRSKASRFDEMYAEELYAEYIKKEIDDTEARKRLRELFGKKDIMVIAPGHSLVSAYDEIHNIIVSKDLQVISVNFIPENYAMDYVFFGNNKRYVQAEKTKCKTIVTSNLYEDDADYIVNYNSLVGTFDDGENSLVLLLRLLKDLEVQCVYIAGADGYEEGERNYYEPSIKNKLKQRRAFNQNTAKAIYGLGLCIEFVTPSIYEKCYREMRNNE